MNSEQPQHELLRVIHRLCMVIVVLLIALGSTVFIIVFHPDLSGGFKKNKEELSNSDKNKKPEETSKLWVAPDTNLIKSDKNAKQIAYGRELIMHTSEYLGPNGKVLHITNGMNCQNCHLEAGTKAWGNNYGAVYATYPKYRPRSGAVESVFKRINDCLERSLNGHSLDTTNTEILAMKAYIEWLGRDLKKGEKPAGSGIYDLAFMDRSADPLKGKELYIQKCQSCHQADGGGQMNTAKTGYTYPPLWGSNSYNDGAGLYRMSRFAGYVKYNMPQGATFTTPQLSNEEAWDLAAFVNSQKRPSGNISADWPKIWEKPFDHPFGPFADGFTEKEHKFGPFASIKEKDEAIKKQKSKS